MLLPQPEAEEHDELPGRDFEIDVDQRLHPVRTLGPDLADVDAADVSLAFAGRPTQERSSQKRPVPCGIQYRRRR